MTKHHGMHSFLYLINSKDGGGGEKNEHRDRFHDHNTANDASRYILTRTKKIKTVSDRTTQFILFISEILK